MGLFDAIGSIIGGSKQAKASKKAIKSQEEMFRQQLGFARESRDQIREDNAPYRESGYTALDTLMDLTGMPRAQKVSQPQGFAGFSGQTINTPFGSFNIPGVQGQEPTSESYSGTPVRTPEEIVRQDPSYQFRLDEEQRGWERSAAARGGLLGGGMLRKHSRYSQDYASTEYGKIYDRIANIAGLAQTGAGFSANATMNAGNVMANAAGDFGASRASGYLQQGNIWSNAINDVASGVGAWMGNRSTPGGGRSVDDDINWAARGDYN